VNTILIVDDQYSETETIVTLIHRYNLPLEARTAHNGEEAIRQLRHQRADILFTDIKMPLMDGLELARQARELYDDIQIIIYSAYGDFEYARKAIGVRAVHYLLKPLEIEVFLDVMKSTVKLCEREDHLKQALQAYGSAPLSGISSFEQTIRSSGVQAEQEGNTRKVIQEVLSIVEQNYGNDISIESIAAQVFLSPSYLGYLFKKQKGQSLRQYITAYRIEQAKHYLDSSNIKILDIGRKVGFPNPSYFTLMFKSQVGLTPAQYREKAVQL